MTDLEALVSLNLVQDLGTIRLKKLLEIFGKPQNILRASSQDLMRASGIGQKISLNIRSFKKEDLERELALSNKLGLKIVTFEDQDYPEILKQISDPPIVLYIKGSIIKEDKLSIGIVGSRRASLYGLNNAETFAADLSEKGFTVISGMARGIDTSAHRGAIRAGGRTIAVIGSGFNRLYPPENKELAEEIANCGAVVSEFPVDMEPFKQNFPRRNRLISGLSLGVLVVEAARNSGALITADFALEQGRDVFAIPGKIDSSSSFGTNELIKQGAKLVCCAEDILEEFDSAGFDARDKRGKKKLDKDPDNALSDSEERRIFSFITEDSIQLDDLVRKSSLDVSRLSGILLKLQLRDLIRQLPGKQFVRRVNER
ncbi:MAG: DNA-processing protein DprA [Candidatus Omnitrophica bacterium]|nr:DNA-processing protein DprA [Candidatus Omnitrophota bacterium]MBU1869462.1 DNA-processing protein DprA [Candidatus Omnitrophota bacterium]